MHLNDNIFNSFPIIKTRRLLLREINDEDATAIWEMRNNKRIAEFIARPENQTIEEAKALIERVKNNFANKDGIGWSTVLRDGKNTIGTCGLNRIEHQNLRAELGGEMSTQYWGKGIALEAVTAIVDFGINQLGLHSIEARVWPTNRGAIYILEQLGFQKEAHLKDALYFKDRFMDIAFYSFVAGK